MAPGRRVALAAAAIASALLGTIRAQTYNRYSPIINNITWAPCQAPDGTPGFQCGTYDVPLDWADPTAGKAISQLIH
jgi:hypothetical protein